MSYEQCISVCGKNYTCNSNGSGYSPIPSQNFDATYYNSLSSPVNNGLEVEGLPSLLGFYTSEQAQTICNDESLRSANSILNQTLGPNHTYSTTDCETNEMANQVTSTV